MTVRELIDMNQHITDATITIREDGWLQDQLNIGLAAGIKPPYPTQVPKEPRYMKNTCTEVRKDAEYIRKSLNAWDDDKDFWEVKTERIPKKWLDLEVKSWHVWQASKVHHPRAGRRVDGDYEHIYITALPSGENMEIKEVPKNTEVNLPGQMSIEDFLGR